MANFIEELLKKDGNVICYNLDILSEFIDTINQNFAAFDNLKILYAIKANGDVRVLKKIADKGIGADCASRQEIKIARDAGFTYISATNPGFNGVDISEILAKDIDFDFDNIGQIIASGIVDKEIGIRVNLKINDSRFGIDVENDDLTEIYNRNLQIKRLHIHFGNKNEFNLRPMCDKIIEILCKNEILSKVESINLGGGYSYLFAHKQTKLLNETITYLNKNLEIKLKRKLLIYIEPGDLFTYPIGYLKTEINYVNQKDAYLNISYFNLSSWNKIYPLAHNGRILTNKEKQFSYSIYGNTCYEEDNFGKYEFDKLLKKGDSLILFPVGAYNFNLIRNLHLMEPPQIVYFENDKMYE